MFRFKKHWCGFRCKLGSTHLCKAECPPSACLSLLPKSNWHLQATWQWLNLYQNKNPLHYLHAPELISFSMGFCLCNDQVRAKLKLFLLHKMQRQFQWLKIHEAFQGRRQPTALQNANQVWDRSQASYHLPISLTTCHIQMFPFVWLLVVEFILFSLLGVQCGYDL